MRFKTKKITLFKNNFLLLNILNTTDCKQPFLKLLLLTLHFPLISNNIRSTCYIIFKSISLEVVGNSMHMKISSKNLI